MKMRSSVLYATCLHCEQEPVLSTLISYRTSNSAGDRGLSFRFGGWKPAEGYLKEYQTSAIIFSGVNSIFKVGSSSIAVPKPLPVITVIPLRKCFLSPSLMCQRPTQIPGEMNSLIDHIRGELKLVGHKGRVLKRARHAAVAIVPSKLVLVGPAGCEDFKNLATYLGF